MIEPTPTANSVVDPLAGLKAKFAELTQIRAQLSGVKVLYQRHDQLVSELIPLFIDTEADKFIVRREITLGADKFRLVPFFFDEKKGCIVPVQWKAAAFRTLTIE